MKEHTALLFINGVPPKDLPAVAGYALIACTDGAFHYLKEKNFPLAQLDFISGDFDSHSGTDESVYTDKFICTPDQDKTDFEKSLEILQQKGILTVHVYGGSGGEMDHFLGNLTVAFRFKDDLKITFFDEFSQYFFSPKEFVLTDVLDKIISLYPFPEAESISTSGLNWELHAENLSQTGRIGTRNFAVADSVAIRYKVGDLLVFVGNKKRPS